MKRHITFGERTGANQGSKRARCPTLENGAKTSNKHPANLCPSLFDNAFGAGPATQTDNQGCNPHRPIKSLAVGSKQMGSTGFSTQRRRSGVLPLTFSCGLRPADLVPEQKWPENCPTAMCSGHANIYIVFRYRCVGTSSKDKSAENDPPYREFRSTLGALY